MLVRKLNMETGTLDKVQDTILEEEVRDPLRAHVAAELSKRHDCQWQCVMAAVLARRFKRQKSSDRIDRGGIKESVRDASLPRASVSSARLIDALSFKELSFGHTVLSGSFRAEPTK